MSGFSFGTPQQPGVPAQQPGASGFSFGAPTAQVSAASTFGALTAAAPAFGATSAAPAFGATAAAPAFGTATAGQLGAAPTFNFGTPAAASTATPTMAFAAPLAASIAPTSVATGVPTFGLGLGAATAQPAANAGFSGFGIKTAATSASLNFGTTTSSASGLTAGGGLFGKPTTTTTAAATAPTPFVGLGGVDVSATQPKVGDSKQDNVKVKETQVPDEIAKTVDSLRAHIKLQKTLASDIGRTSTSKLSNVSGEILNLQWALQEIANSVEVNYNQIKLLRKETTKTIQAVEMAQRTQDTPAGLQFENLAPFQYFQNLVAKYEQDLMNFRQQIALTERHMRSLTNPQNVSPEDLKRGFQQINESFVSLAGRLHEIHQKVEGQKEQFLNLRKYRLHDATNVFAHLDNPEKQVDTSRITSGPTPFSSISAMSSFGKSFSNTATGAGSGSSGVGAGASQATK